MASKLKLPEVSRRKLLVGAGVGAGLVIGYFAWPRDRALNWTTRTGETLVNGWVKIDTSGRVIVAVPQAEMGQGVYTSLPQLLADELGADWRTVGVEPAPLHPVYANTFMSRTAAEGLPSMLQGLGRWALVEIAQRLSLQLTGGSTSIMAYYDTMRLAGASARELLCKAAARRWDVDWTECDTANGFVEHKGKRLRFADLIDEVDPEEAPAEPKLRATPRLTGRSAPRIDVPAKVDGSARFGLDVRLPGMVYAAIKAGPIDGARLARVDTGAAKRRAGVIDVVEGPTWVAVVADTWWGARSALDEVKASFERSAKSASSAAIDKALRAALSGDGVKAFRDEGDAGNALKTNAVQATYGVPFLAHSCLEPMNATVRLTENGAEVWAPTQSATLVNWRVADALGLPEDRVTVFPTLLGGGFGRKAETDACVQAALIAKKVKRPVQLIWTREEDTAHDKFRPAARARMRAKLGPDKRIAAWDATIAVPNVGASFMSRNIPSLAGGDDKASGQLLGGALLMPYDIPAVRVAHSPVRVPVPLGFWRSVEHSYNAFFVESFIDEMAHSAGVDPLTFRLRMLAKSPRHAEVLRRAAAEAGYMGVGEEGAAQGVALHESFGSIVAQVAEVTVKDGQIAVNRVTCAIDCGRVVNPDIVRQQMEGGIIYGLTAALHGTVTFADGLPEQTNFDTYPLLSMAETPEIDVHIIDSSEAPGGVGEPGVPPIAPAIANAVFAATGMRVRDLPFAGKTLG